MAIRIYDTLSRRTVELHPREPGRISMYSCGPTVYNFIHIGNARTALWYDLIRRYLSYRGYGVTFVSNYTDVDDKIIERAGAEKIAPHDVASKYADAYEKDMSALGVRPPDRLTKATEHISEMVEAIEELIGNGLAYEADGNVFFAVERFTGYGKLSRRALEEMRAGERIEPHPGKRHPLDFALWKSAKAGEPSWPSPWGPGRPGWHIECSVMSVKYLGMGFDIHGGATDLIFPHHENEIAQAEGLHPGERFARYWLHAGLVQMDSEKMSKSLGNVALATEVLERWPGETIRYWAMTGSYRSQASFSEASLADADAALERWRTFYSSAHHALGDAMPAPHNEYRRPLDAPIGDPYVARFVAAMDDDFSSPEALATAHDLVSRANQALEAVQRGHDEARAGLVSLTSQWLEMITVMGFRFEAGRGGSELVARLIDYLLTLREDARGERAFDRADAIRDELAGMGVAVEDTPAGPRWRVH